MEFPNLEDSNLFHPLTCQCRACIAGSQKLTGKLPETSATSPYEQQEDLYKGMTVKQMDERASQLLIEVINVLSETDLALAMLLDKDQISNTTIMIAHAVHMRNVIYLKSWHDTWKKAREIAQRENERGEGENK